ncbi:hypothetical protein ACLOJK_007942 [Asimina triloba]
MQQYQRVEKPRPEKAINENEIRITTQGLIRNYISYATSLLQYDVMSWTFSGSKKQPELSQIVNTVGLYKKNNLE